MGTLTTTFVSPSNPKLNFQRKNFNKLKTIPAFPVARLFGPAIFEASKLKVLFLGADEKKHPGHNIPRTYKSSKCISYQAVNCPNRHQLLPKNCPQPVKHLSVLYRVKTLKSPTTYTLTHSDVTSKLTLAISQSINNSQLQGWYNKLQRDEVVAEWKKLKGVMSLHVHCHRSGGHFLLDLFARLRYYIFCKELPVVLKAFVHGDVNLFKEYPELEDALVWVYFHSNIPEFNKVECWGPLKNASQPLSNSHTRQNDTNSTNNVTPDQPCLEDCSCCFPPMSSIPWPSKDLEFENGAAFLNQQLP